MVTSTLHMCQPCAVSRHQDGMPLVTSGQRAPFTLCFFCPVHSRRRCVRFASAWRDMPLSQPVVATQGTADSHPARRVSHTASPAMASNQCHARPVHTSTCVVLRSRAALTSLLLDLPKGDVVTAHPVQVQTFHIPDQVPQVCFTALHIHRPAADWLQSWGAGTLFSKPSDWMPGRLCLFRFVVQQEPRPAHTVWVLLVRQVSACLMLLTGRAHMSLT
jgi:hypothetical protein